LIRLAVPISVGMSVMFPVGMSAEASMTSHGSSTKSPLAGTGKCQAAITKVSWHYRTSGVAWQLAGSNRFIMKRPFIHSQGFRDATF